MGWERKRQTPRAQSPPTRATGHQLRVDGRRRVVGVRYVMTLDADTRLPRGAVDRLVGTMAHPLNRPRFDPAKAAVVEGYAVLQPE